MKRSLLNRSAVDIKKRKMSTPGGNYSNSQVKVYVRVRPFNDREKICSCRKIISIVDGTSIVFDPEIEEEPFYFKSILQKGRDITRRANKNLLFEFDKVFDESSTNQNVFQDSTKNIISSIFEGYNCSVFAYGATGAGKTFTMLGTEEQPGIAYLTIVELLEHIEKLQDTKVTLGASYLEVYNENVKDLLHPSNAVLHLREDGSGGRTTVAGLHVQQINHSGELFSLLSEGNRNRTQHPTDSNEESSRSHAVFQVHVRISAQAQVKISKLSMIDLAGSERASATGCKGQRFKEGANINKSLLALGNCINALADGLSHVPYRDSKLTRILKDSIGGNCRTVMIANISPSSSAFEDTYNTLKYAARTKCIKSTISKNIMNESISIPRYKKIVQELNEEITRIKESGIPDFGDWEKRIEAAFEDRKKISKEILSLCSQVKLNDWRIQQKEMAVSYIDQTDKSICSNRLGTSINQLKVRSESIRGRLSEFLPLQEENKLIISKIEEDISSQPKLGPFLKTIFEKHKLSVDVEEHKIRMAHLEKLLKLKSKREINLNAAIATVPPVLHEFRLLLKVHGHLTQELSSKYESAMKCLEGVKGKGISWCDDEDEEEDDGDFQQLGLNSIGEPDSDLLNRTRTLTTTIIVPSTFPLKQNNRLENMITRSPKPKWVLKPKFVPTHLQRTTQSNKESIVKRTTGLVTPITKFKPSTATNRSIQRPHPYRRTPFKPTNTNNLNIKAIK